MKKYTKAEDFRPITNEEMDKIKTDLDFVTKLKQARLQEIVAESLDNKRR